MLLQCSYSCKFPASILSSTGWRWRYPMGARSRFHWKLHPSSQAWPLLSTSNRGETAIAKCGNWDPLAQFHTPSPEYCTPVSLNIRNIQSYTISQFLMIIISNPSDLPSNFNFREWILVKFKSKYQHFYTRKWVWKCCLQNGSHFASASKALNVLISFIGSC